MGALKFANNASALLAASIDDNDLAIQVAGGYGALFPSPGVGEYFLATLENADGDIEIVKITSRSTDLLTVASGGRGQEGTSAQSWTNGLTRVEVRLTKAILELFLQRDGDTMDGDLDMQDNDIVDVNVTGESTFTGTEIVDTPIRGATGDDSNELLVPGDGSRATAGGARLLAEGDDLGDFVFQVGMVIDWYGALVDLPDNWQQCDGTNGTPDLRNKFVIGVGSSNILGATGGATTASGSTGAGGGHTHTGAGAAHALTVAELPAHSHRLWAWVHGDDQDGNNKDFQSGDRGVTGPVETAGHGYYSKTGNETGHKFIEDAGTGDAHTHTVTMDAVTDHTHTVGVAIIPPYVALYKIMYVGP